MFSFLYHYEASPQHSKQNETLGTKQQGPAGGSDYLTPFPRNRQLNKLASTAPWTAQHSAGRRRKRDANA